MTSVPVRLLHTSVALGLVAIMGCWSAAAQTAPPTLPAQQPGKVTTMPEDSRKKLDAFLKQAVQEQRSDSLKVMIRLATRDGADARVLELLTKLGLKVERTLSGGRLLLTTIKVEDLIELAASDDVAGVSFDSIVKPQRKGS